MTILVTGGAGYIGRHVIRALTARGERVAVVDLPEAEERVDVPFLGVDLAEAQAIQLVADFAQAHGATAIVHLAARKRVDESVARPEWYQSQNVGGLQNTLAAARAVGIGRFVFSSTAAVYASSDEPVTEDAMLAPANPYGQTKLDGERLVAHHADAVSGRAVSLRYFNVAGADHPSLAEHEAHNLIPLVVARLAAGTSPIIYGSDYPTSDGTCVRDFIHVADLADAHLAALDALDAGPVHRVYNVGTGAGASVLDVVNRLIRISGVQVPPRFESRRAGDPAVVVADPRRIREQLGWRAQRGLDEILSSAWHSRP